MNRRTKVAHALADWRLWAALSAFGAIMCVGLALKSTTDQNDDLRSDNQRLVEQVDQQGEVTQCRSRAAVFADSTASVQDALVALGLSAVGRGQSTAPYADALDVARRNTTAAIHQRDLAVDECQQNPAYSIDPSILEPVPSYPLPPKG